MKNSRLTAIACVFPLILGSCVGAMAFYLPDTAQTKCYHSVTYVEIPCAGTRQDGEYNINPMRYTDNLNGTVTDKNTGLVWQQQDDGNTYNWYKASGTFHSGFNPNSQNLCELPNLGGYIDWRLPSNKELMTIVNYGIPYTSPGPAIDTTYFPNAKPDPYWSSTTYAYNYNYAWLVNFNDGYIGNTNKSYSIYSYVRCVRGGQLNFGDFQDNGNGTVTDKSTGLMWQQGEGGDMSWSSALDYCGGLGLGDHSDWRLPNVKELKSITDDTRWNPAINTVFFPNAVASYYWSSTTSAGSPSSAWYVMFYDGCVCGVSVKDAYHYYVRCVRGGQSGSLGSLDIARTGTGSGTVVSWPAGIDCGSTCSALFPINSTIIVSATPEVGGSIFAGWSGDPDCAYAVVALSTDKSCTATFDLCNSASVAMTGSSGPFGSISAAYLEAASTDIIKVIASNQEEGDLVFGGKIITLQGGYDCAFTEPPITFTTITGSFTITSGTTTLDGIIIR